MALNVYLRREDVPKSLTFIDNNDVSFDKGIFFGSINITKDMARAISVLDNATFIPPDKIETQYGTIASVEDLSTGTKTMLNAMNDVSTCVNTIECGCNALYWILQLKSGNILLSYYPECKDAQIDTILHFKGKQKHFSSLTALADVVYSCMTEGK